MPPKRLLPMLCLRKIKIYSILLSIFVVEISGPLVQWIEFQIPVLTIWVRIPWESQKNLVIFTLTRFFVFSGMSIGVYAVSSKMD
jgi:hypothetical protein